MPVSYTHLDVYKRQAVKLSDFADVSERIQYLVTQVEEISELLGN